MTASIIAIIQLSCAVGKGLRKIINLKNAPDILLALNNEVADLQCTVQDTDDLLRQHSEPSGVESTASVDRALINAKKTLHSLESLVADELTLVKSKNNEFRLNRSVWLRSEGRIQQLKDDVQRDRLSLSSALLTLAS